MRVSVTAEGLVALTSVAFFSAAALLMGDNLVFLLGVLLLSAAFMARRRARANLEHFEVGRSLPDRARVGSPTAMSWTLTAPPEAPLLGLSVSDHPIRGMNPREIQVDFAAVHPGDVVRAETGVTFTRRGRFRAGTVEIWSRFPLGVFEARVRRRADIEVLVHPRTGRPTRHLLDALRGQQLHTTNTTRNWRGDDMLHGVREYREGDDPRRIHWRTTARTGTLIVSEWRAQESDDVVVVLGPTLGQGPQSLARLERAISVVATIWTVLVRDDVRARLVLDHGRPIMGGRGARGVHAMDRLAELPTSRKRTPWRGLEQVPPSAGHRTVFFIATGPAEDHLGRVERVAGRRGDIRVIRCDLTSHQRYVRGLL